MSQTALLGTGAVPSIPVTGSNIGVVPPSPLTGTTVQAIIDELQAEIAAGTGVTVREVDLTPSVAATIIELPNGSLTILGTVATAHLLTSRGGEQGETQTITASGAAQTLDLSLYNTFDITLTANCTLTFSNPSPSGVDAHWLILLRQGGTGSYTVTWPGTVVWQDPTDGTTGGAAPTLWTAVGAQNAIDISSTNGGTTYGGSMGGGSGVPATTVTDETTLGISPAVGTDTEYARQDHTHGSPSATTIIDAVAGHAHVASETHLSDGSSGLYTLDEYFLTGSVAAWNVTSLARLSVTETAPDQATVSPVGSSGDSILFDYAAIL